MSTPAPNVKAVFDRAAEIASPVEREAYLAEACAGRPDVRGQVEALLRALGDAGSFLESGPVVAPAGDATEASDDGPRRPRPASTLGEGATAAGATPAAPIAARVGRDGRADEVIAGKYTLVEPIGEGGMGSVWLRRQTEPVKRYVAVKLIKAGMDSRPGPGPVRGRAPGPGADGPPEHRPRPRRRPARRPALLRHGAGQGRADHRVLRRPPAHAQGAAGTVRAGLPGDPARPPEGGHPPRHQAVQRPDRPLRRPAGAQGDRLRRGQGDRPGADGAHDRDGLRRGGRHAAVHEPGAGDAQQPRHRHPQRRLRPGGAPLRAADRLDAVLDGRSWSGRGVLEILRVVREEEPPRPSTKLSTADALPSLSASPLDRAAGPDRPAAERAGLGGDEGAGEGPELGGTRRPTRSRRTSGGYLEGEAVQAHPPGAGYRLRKFVRRNKGRVVAAALVLLALVAGVVGTSIGLVRATRPPGRSGEPRRRP